MKIGIVKLQWRSTWIRVLYALWIILNIPVAIFCILGTIISLLFFFVRSPKLDAYSYESCVLFIIFALYSWLYVLGAVSVWLGAEWALYIRSKFRLVLPLSIMQVLYLFIVLSLFRLSAVVQYAHQISLDEIIAVTLPVIFIAGFVATSIFAGRRCFKNANSSFNLQEIAKQRLRIIRKRTNAAIIHRNES